MGECIAYQKMKITQLHIEKIIFQLLLYQSNAERLSGHMRSIVSMNGFIRVLQIPSALEDQREDNLLLVAYGNSADRRDCPFGSMEVIVNGDSLPPKRTVDGVEKTYPPITTEEKLARKNELKARENEDLKWRCYANRKPKEALYKIGRKRSAKVNDRYKKGEGYHDVPSPYTGNFMPPKPDLVLVDKDEYVFSESATSVPLAATSEVKTSVSKSKSISEPLIEDWISNSENENKTESKSGQRKPSNAKVEFVKSYEHLKSPRESVKKVENNKQAKYPRKNSQSSRDYDFYEKKMVEKPVWNNARRVNHQNSQRITYPHPKRNFVPRVVLMKSGYKSLNTARQSSSRAAVSVVFNDEYDTPSHTKKVFANMKRKGKDFSRTVTPLFATMLIQPQEDVGEGSGQLTKSQHTPTTASPSHVEPIPTVASSSHPKKTQKHRKTKRNATEISQSSGPTTLVADKTVHEKRGDSMERATTTATSLDAEQGSAPISPWYQDTILGDRPAQTRFKRLSKQSNDPPLSRVNTLGSGEDKTQGRYGHDISTAEVTTASVPSNVDVSAASPIRPVDDSITDDITLAEPLMKIKTKDKGKGIIQEPEKPVKVKGKDQIEYDVDVAQRLQEELDEEVRLEREREEEASKATNIVEWDDVQAMMDADYELAAKLQAEEQGEISIEERSRLFMELMDKRKKHFEKLRTKKKPPTKTQKRNIMSTYLKNMAGYKHTHLKNKSFEEIQMLFEKEMKRVNIFVDMDAELFSQLIKEFDREDLENLWKLVKTKHGYTRPEEAYERVLWGDLKVMFEPDVEDNIWRNLQRQKILLWKLYDSYRIHFVRFENMHIYMIVEKRYPLSPTTITDMLNRKLQADYWDETCYQLLKLITKQLKNP
ncbi:hypothetical protein Tco_0519754 [Tanacetum coccineum]